MYEIFIVPWTHIDEVFIFNGGKFISTVERIIMITSIMFHCVQDHLSNLVTISRKLNFSENLFLHNLVDEKYTKEKV